MKKSFSDRIFDILNISYMILFTLIMLYPLYFVIIASFSDAYSVTMGKVFLFPKNLTLDSYINVLSSDKIWEGYKNTIFYTLLGTLWNLVLTIPAAYVLSKPRLPGRTFLSWYFLFTMYFSGGLIPTYLLVRDIGLYNRSSTLIILGGVSVFNMIIARVYYQTSIPEEIYEAARIDGASELRVFFQIALPLSAPIIAVLALFYGVTRWNDFFTALVYIINPKLYPLQLVLRQILIENASLLDRLITAGSYTQTQLDEANKAAYMAESMKYSIIFVSSLPLLVVYPFVQKYFVKGLMIGSIKG